MKAVYLHFVMVNFDWSVDLSANGNSLLPFRIMSITVVYFCHVLAFIFFLFISHRILLLFFNVASHFVVVF